MNISVSERYIQTGYRECTTYARHQQYPDPLLLQKGKVEQIGFSPIKAGLFPVIISISFNPILRLGLSGTASL